MLHNTRGWRLSLASLILFMLSSTTPLFCEDIEWSKLMIPGVLVPEDEEALFSYSINNSEVDLLASGRWKSSVGIGTGFRIQPSIFDQRFVTGTSMPGFTPALFQNEASISSTVWLDKTWFV